MINTIIILQGIVLIDRVSTVFAPSKLLCTRVRKAGQFWPNVQHSALSKLLEPVLARSPGNAAVERLFSVGGGFQSQKRAASM